MKFLNDNLLKNQEFKGQPRGVVKPQEEIRTLKTKLAIFVNGTNNLNKLLGYCRSSSDKSGNGYDGKIYVNDSNTIVCYFCGKTGHMMSKCRDQYKKGTTNTFMANTKDPKRFRYIRKRLLLL